MNNILEEIANTDLERDSTTIEMVRICKHCLETHGKGLRRELCDLNDPYVYSISDCEVCRQVGVSRYICLFEITEKVATILKRRYKNRYA